MRHHSKTKTLSRPRRQRTALIRNLAIELILRKKIKTTEAKAKVLRPFVERLVTHAKKDTVAGRRHIATTLGEPKNEVIQKLHEDIATSYKDRNGGYTRIIKMGQMQSGKTEAVIEFV